MKPSADHPFRSTEAKAEYLARYDAAAKAWPIPSEGKMADTAYGQTFVRVSGPVGAPPLVLLPGAGSCSLQWIPNIAALSGRYRTYAVDSLINTGCVGRSVYTRAITGPADVGQWLDELFNGLGLADNVNLLGASYGGWPAGRYALHAPGRLSKIIWVAPAGTVLPFRAGYLLRSIFLNLSPRRNTYIRFFKWCFKDLAQKDMQMLEAIADEFLLSARCFEPVNPRQLPALTPLTDEEWQRINAPALFLVGENEVLYSAQKAVQRLNKVAPHIQTDIIANAGHDLLLVQTELVNQKITAFLAQP
ncbi:MAG: alpha/beta hydrolase [Anaerolineae bacterium]|nr:alpha/beta hydrolase [Anaerolineae bacterium]